MKVAHVLLSLVVSTHAQQTVFTVPIADVLDKGNVYGELDVITPRVVIGVGHRMEAGMNANGFSLPGEQSFTPTPTIKWKTYDGK